MEPEPVMPTDPLSSSVLILNPAAGTGEAVERVAAWASRRPGCVLWRTRGAGDARRLAAEACAAGAGTVIVAGGDGTIHEVVNGLDLSRALTLGVVPLGTGNDLARSLGLPTHDTDAALAVIDAGHHEPMDLLEAACDGDSPRRVVNAASGGFSDVLHRHLTGDMKRVFGPAAYALAAVNAFSKAPNHRVRIGHDDGLLRTQACAVMVCNGRFAAGGQEIAPDASTNDRSAKLICVAAPTWGARFALLLRYYLGRYLTDERVTSRDVCGVTVHAEPAMRFYADGEPLGHTPLRMAVLSGALRVLVPAKPAPGTSGH